MVRNNKYLELLRNLAPALIVSLIVTAWFFVFQERPYQVAKSSNYLVDRLINAFVRTISHLSFRHFRGNIIVLFLLIFTTKVFSGLKFLLVNFVTILVLNILIMMFKYQRAVGSSVLVFGLLIVSILVFAKFQYYALKSDSTKKEQGVLCLLIVLFSIFFSAYSVSLLADLLIVLRIISIENPSVFEFAVSDIDNYTRVSSKGHIFGVISGFFSFVFWNAVFRIQRWNFFGR